MSRISVEKKDAENSSNLLKRFTRKVRQSGILKEAKAKRFKNRPLSSHKKKEVALARQRRFKKLEQLRKLGKID